MRTIQMPIRALLKQELKGADICLDIDIVLVQVTPPFEATCSIWCGPDVGGKHLYARLLVGLLHQPSPHLRAHSPLHLQQLLTAQTQGVQDSLPLSVLNGKTVRYRCHHGGTLPTATL